MRDNYEGGGVAVICAQAGKKSPNERSSWKTSGCLEEAHRSPACCRERHEYPPAYTMFECRLDGNQPIAQVVQVPPDTTDNINQNETCMLLETKQSEFGPTSRVAAYPAQTRSRYRPSGALSFALEARDSPDGAVACVGKIADNIDEGHSANAHSQPVTTLETTKCPSSKNGPYSRLVYGPISEGVEKHSRTYKNPVLYIECSTTPKGPIARVTQVPRDVAKSSGDAGTHYEAFVRHDGACPTATATESNKKDGSSSRRACEFMEAWVDPSGPRARAVTLPERCSNVRHLTHLEVRPKTNGPSARIVQHPGNLQSMIPNLRSNRENRHSSSLCFCGDQSSNRTTCLQSPENRQTVSWSRKVTNELTPSVMNRRNGLTPTPSEIKLRTGSSKQKGRRCECSGIVAKSRSAHNCPPDSWIGRGPPVCRVQPAPCASNKSPTLEKRTKLSSSSPRPCLCPAQSRVKSPVRPSLAIHPLPGGSVFPRCPAPSLPDIAPVPLGPNRLRDYKPRPKTTGPRPKTTGASPNRTKQPPKITIKSIKPTKSAGKKPRKKTTTKNKKSGSSKEIIELPESSDDDKEKPSTNDSVETLYIECPAFASKAIQSDQVGEEPSHIACPAFESKGNQATLFRNEPSYTKCPAFESKGNQTVVICEKPTYVDCPAFASKTDRSVPRFEEPTYVTCPAFASGRSSEASTMYVPRDDLLNAKYPEYFVRSKSMKASEACQAKRNDVHQCHHHRVNHEERRERQARTLISSGRRLRRFEAEFNEPSRRSYCVRDVKNRKNEPHTHPKKVHATVSPLEGDKKNEDSTEEPGKLVLPDVLVEGKKTIKLRAVKSRELLAGVVYYDCDCYHRNGLQQDCPRGECRGRKKCLTKPWPNCDMSKYFRWKWGRYYKLLDLIPPSTFCGPRDVLFNAKMGRNYCSKVETKDEKLGKTSEGQEKMKHREKRPKHQQREHRKVSDDKCCQQYAIIPIAVNNSFRE